METAPNIGHQLAGIGIVCRGWFSVLLATEYLAADTLETWNTDTVCSAVNSGQKIYILDRNIYWKAVLTYLLDTYLTPVFIL